MVTGTSSHMGVCVLNSGVGGSSPSPPTYDSKPESFLISSQVKRVTAAQKRVMTEVTKRFPSSRNLVQTPPTKIPRSIESLSPVNLGIFICRLHGGQINFLHSKHRLSCTLRSFCVRASQIHSHLR